MLGSPGNDDAFRAQAQALAHVKDLIMRNVGGEYEPAEIEDRLYFQRRVFKRVRVKRR